ncbi:MAG: GvpL/GvpF family gas vesicle protein [Chlorobium sp.]|nr:MAG: hypothetical protein FDX17_04360 [Chlorobium sp.]
MSLIIYALIQNGQKNSSIKKCIDTFSEEIEINLKIINYKELSAVFSVEVQKVEKADKADFIKYAEIIDKISKTCTLLPMRYGSLVTSYDDLYALLDKNYSAFLESIHKINGKEEYSVKVLFSSKNQDNIINNNLGDVSLKVPNILMGTSDSKQYLLEKYKKHTIEERRNKYIEKLKLSFLDEVRKLTECVEFNKTLTSAFIIDAVVLIEKYKKEKLLEGIDNLRKMYPENNIIITGPWPPYNFVNINIQ